MSLESVAISRGIVESPASAHPLVEELRQVLIARGQDGSGFCDFYRRFCAIDRGASRILFLDEFKIAFQRCNLNFSDQEISSIFYFFDIHDRKYIDYDEFFIGLRGPVSEKRRYLIEKAFQQIDVEGRGMIDPEVLIDRYDPADHPDVKGNNKKAPEVFRDFLRSFDVSTEVDGKITRQEFENYYYNMSICVDRDEYFEQILCSTWHITGYDSAWEGNYNRSNQRNAYKYDKYDNRTSMNKEDMVNNGKDYDNNNRDKKYRNGPSSSYANRERSMSPSGRSPGRIERAEREIKF